MIVKHNLLLVVVLYDCTSFTATAQCTYPVAERVCSAHEGILWGDFSSSNTQIDLIEALAGDYFQLGIVEKGENVTKVWRKERGTDVTQSLEVSWLSKFQTSFIG